MAGSEASSLSPSQFSSLTTPKSLKCFYLFLCLTSPKLSWLLKTFPQQKNHLFCYPSCCSPIKKSPGRRETSSHLQPSVASGHCRSYARDHFPSTSHQPHLPPTEIAAGTCRTPCGAQQCPLCVWPSQTAPLLCGQRLHAGDAQQAWDWGCATVGWVPATVWLLV